MNFIFAGYTLREKFFPNEFEEYIRNRNIENCETIYTLDTSLCPTVTPYDGTSFEEYGNFVNCTGFYYELENMKKYLNDETVILGAFVEEVAVEKIPMYTEKDKLLFAYARYANQSIDSSFVFRGYEVAADDDYSISASTNCGHTRDELEKYGEITEGLLYKDYDSACRFRDYLNSNPNADHVPVSVWQIWSL